MPRFKVALECLQGIITTVWIAGEIRLTHSSDEVLDAPAVGNRASNR